MINISFQRGSEVRSLTRSKEYVSLVFLLFSLKKTPLNEVVTIAHSTCKCSYTQFRDKK